MTLKEVMEKSAREQLAELPEKEQRKILGKLSKEELLKLQYDWKFHARPKQYKPISEFLDSSHSICLITSGRGFGKTRTGAEWVRYVMENGIYRRGTIVGPTAANARDIMIKGDGILSVCPPDNMPVYESSKLILTWPNGGIVTIASADNPARLRGQNNEFIWADELASWDKAQDAWDQLMFTLRKGHNPKALVTSTPQPLELIANLFEESEKENPDVMLIEGSSYENQANLNPRFLAKILQKYEGTDLGDQEIHGRLLKNLGGLFKREYIVHKDWSKLPHMLRTVVAVDPAASSKATSDDTGLAVCAKGLDNNYYLLHVEGIKRTPKEWADRVAELYKVYNADLIVAEINNGGEMVEETIQKGYKDLPVKVIHASRGKTKRAEPISLLYQKGKVFHVNHDRKGALARLINEAMRDAEKQMFVFRNLPNEKNDKVDAIVYGFAELSENDYKEFETPAIAGVRNSHRGVGFGLTF
jgi:phage terminase large subunit-like protein